MFTTIVVGFDGREGGRNALLLAHSLQERAGGTLVAVHVYPYEPFQVWGLRPEVERLVRDQTDALVRAQLREAGVDAQLLVTPFTSRRGRQGPGQGQRARHAAGRRAAGRDHAAPGG
jgi:hypothetical protein